MYVPLVKCCEPDVIIANCGDKDAEAIIVSCISVDAVVAYEEVIACVEYEAVPNKSPTKLPVKLVADTDPVTISPFGNDAYPSKNDAVAAYEAVAGTNVILVAALAVTA